jgi:hypothetical protein
MQSEVRLWVRAGPGVEQLGKMLSHAFGEQPRFDHAHHGNIAFAREVFDVLGD